VDAVGGFAGAQRRAEIGKGTLENGKTGKAETRKSKLKKGNWKIEIRQRPNWTSVGMKANGFHFIEKNRVQCGAIVVNGAGLVAEG
jgi:hypothetical protein